MDDADNTSARNRTQKIELSKRENSLVFRSRLVFFLLLALIAIIMGVLTHKYSQEVEDKDFETRVSSKSVQRVQRTVSGDTTATP